MTITTLSQNRCFGGVQGTYAHESAETRCKMRFGVFMPPQAGARRVPLLYWLSGLTCTEENFIIKAGAQRVASELGIALVIPDTSPRGLNLPGDADAYDFGVGAGFYVDALVAPWSTNYRMYSYVARELPQLVGASFPTIDASRASIFGHSMGGHGALTIALKNPGAYKSVSAFAPICSPMRCPWGEKALGGYLGPDRSKWREYDATALIEERGWKGPILVDQGTKDQFLDNQLKPELLKAACAERSIPLEIRMQEGYDHSYFFIASFVEDHLRFHARHL